MALLDYPNMSMADMGVILGDYNAKFSGILSFWLLFLLIIQIILMNIMAKMGFVESIMFASLVNTALSAILFGMGLLVWTHALIFGAIFIISLVFFVIKG